jgi:hypothetical protein
MRKRSRIPEYNAFKKDTALFVMRPTSAVPVKSSGGKGKRGGERIVVAVACSQISIFPNLQFSELT